MARLNLHPLLTLKVSQHQIPAHALIPNTSIQNEPLFIHHSCLLTSSTASTIESHLKTIDVVVPQWRYNMYSTTHFHSSIHEVLCISSGKARLCFGDEENPRRIEPVVEKGDVIIVPAGVGHRLLDDFDSGFEMVGSYPKGNQWDMCYGKKGEESKVNSIAELSWFEKDPLYGDEGPVLQEEA